LNLFSESHVFDQQDVPLLREAAVVETVDFFFICREVQHGGVLGSDDVLLQVDNLDDREREIGVNRAQSF